MKCPKCQFKNPSDALYCNKCGTKLEIVCPECNKANPIGSLFCNQCGHSLSPHSGPIQQELSFDEKIEKIQRYLPQGLTEKILAQRGKIEGERKQVTVMFCDMAGFTELSEKLGPEEAYSIMNEVYEILIHKVHELEGTVNEMTGDGVMALFGAPISLEDAPQRAIRSAMAIHREMTKFNEKLTQQQAELPVLKMRIGIHTGTVVVGTLGNDLRVEFKAVGDTVNLASRLESLAEPGATFISEDTFKLTEGLFRFEALGAKPIKGKKNPIKIYRVIATSSRRTRFDVSTERGLTPFVGRDRELELLVDGFKRSKTGRGQAFSIMAEAGVGKSRLLYEFRKAVSNEDITFFEGKCLSYSRGVAYHPVIDVLKSNFNILDTDDCKLIKDKVKQWHKNIGIDEPSTLPYLLELLSVKDSGIERIQISPEARKDRIMSAVRLITLKGSEIRPLVIAVEDLHWIDRSSEEYLKTLLESISGARIFLIFTYRPEYVHTWGGKSYHNQINLNRLSNRESLAMVSHLLGTEDIDSRIEELVLEKTEGVPFFVEEFVKSLKDLKIIEETKKKIHIVKDIKNIVIPSTIQEVIMSRVDSLPETAKELLQIGSAIEREFSYQLVKKASGFNDNELLSRLSVLKDSELLYERGIYPQSTYVFKHALTQEVVYDSILGKRRKKLHDALGKIIEETHKDTIEEHYEVLADHFIKAENYEKAEDYCRLMSKKAEKTASLMYAIDYSKKRITCLAKLHQTENVQKKTIDARTILGLYLSQMAYHIQAENAVAPVIDLAKKYKYNKRLCQIYSIMGAYNLWFNEDFPKAFQNLEIALKISKEINDLISIVMANTWLGFGLSLICEFKKAHSHLKDAIKINEKAKNLWGAAVLKSYLSLFIYFAQGSVDKGYQQSLEALELAHQSDDIYSKSAAYICHGVSCYGKGFFDEAIQHLLKAIDYSKNIHLSSWQGLARMLLGDIFSETGEIAQSKKNYSESFLIFEESQIQPTLRNFAKIGSACAKAMNNEQDIDIKALFDLTTLNKIKQYDGQIANKIGKIFLHTDEDDLTDAESWIKKAIEADRKNGMMFHLAKDYILYADLFRRKKDIPKAKETLSKAIEIFTECGADGWVEKYEKELAAM